MLFLNLIQRIFNVGHIILKTQDIIIIIVTPILLKVQSVYSTSVDEFLK